MNIKSIAVRIIAGIFLMLAGGLLAVGIVFPDYMEKTNDYQIIIAGINRKPITVYARGEQKGLLGQHEAIIISPENIASRKWTYNPDRDLRYNGENSVFYKIENGALHIYSQQILTNIDYSLWEVPIVQESLKTAKRWINQSNSRENGYCVIAVAGMTE